MAFNEQQPQSPIGTLQAWVSAVVTIAVIVFVFKIGYGILITINTMAESNTDIGAGLTPTMRTALFEKYIFVPLAGIILVLIGVVIYGLLIGIKHEYGSERF